MAQIRVQRDSVRVQRGSVGSALACCKAGPSSNLGSPPWEFYPLSEGAMKNGERPRRMKTAVSYECDFECMY